MGRIVLCVFIVFNILVCQRAIAQDNIGVKFFGLSIHPKGEKENAFLMPNKLDKDAYLVMNFGAELMYEKFLYKDVISAKIVQALYADCAEKLGGFSHIGIRIKIAKNEEHSFYGGIGPTLVYRKNWQKIEGYVNPNKFQGEADDNWQYLFLWYGGELEYKYVITDKLDFSVSFVPGYPDLMSLAFGVSFKLN